MRTWILYERERQRMSQWPDKLSELEIVLSKIHADVYKCREEVRALRLRQKPVKTCNVQRMDLDKEIQKLKSAQEKLCRRTEMIRLRLMGSVKQIKKEKC